MKHSNRNKEVKTNKLTPNTYSLIIYIYIVYSHIPNVLYQRGPATYTQQTQDVLETCKHDHYDNFLSLYDQFCHV